MALFHNHGLEKKPLREMMHQVIASGSIKFEDEDMVAYGVAQNFKTLGWKNVRVKHPGLGS